MVQDDFWDKWPSKYSSSQPNSILNNFCYEQNLVDAWRHLNPNTIRFTWFNTNYKSRIDHWLVANDLLSYEINTDISAAPLTDHCLIYLQLKPKVSTWGTTKYWKFNSTLLNYDSYCDGIRSILSGVITSEELDTSVRKWEFFKYKVRQFSISFSKTILRESQKKEIDLVKELNFYCSNSSPTEDDKQKIRNLQSTLDEMYTQKAKGAFIRSRAKWIEEGEKNNAYFCNLEKRRQKQNSIKSILINNIEITDDEIISKEILKFYDNLYSSKFSEENCNNFLNSIEMHIPKINDDFRLLCDDNITSLELDKAVKRLSLNKAPGPDGLTANFYHHFWEEIKDLLFGVFSEIFESCDLPPTMRHGVIISIPKADKDHRIIENRRPITLRNTDYKLLTYIFKIRVQSGISDIVSETQSGFLKGRSIHNNIRLVMDIIEYSDMINDDGFILFLDFYKAFDSVEHQFIFSVLEHLGFGVKFTNLIRGLYRNISSCVSLPRGSTPRFNVSVGIPQGCPISPCLFILVSEMLAIYLKNCVDLKKLNVLGTELIISQLADDTTLFLKDYKQIPIAIDKIKLFSAACGLKLNLKKCELLAIHDSPLKEICNIPIKSEIKYLGTYISKDQQFNLRTNITNKLNEIKAKLNIWLQRDLSILGRIYLTKMESISRLVYPTCSTAISNNLIKKINTINFNFIWRNKPHYIKKDEMVKEIKDGGLKVIDFNCLNGTLKINWLKSWLKNPNAFWYSIPSHIFNKMGGLKILLLSDFDINKLPTKLSEFHKQVLMYWKLLYVHNYSPHSSIIWNNRYVLCRNRSLFYEDWMNRKIWSVVHLMKDNGELLGYDEFCLKYNFSPPKSDFIKLLIALPKEVVFQYRNIIQHQPINPQYGSISIQGIPLTDKKCTNQFIRRCFTDQLYPCKVNKNNIIYKFGKSSIIKLRTLYLKLPVQPKVKETHFKILNNVYPSKDLLRKRFNIDDNSCSFCGKDVETTDHIFFECNKTRTFWNCFENWIQPQIGIPCPISRDVVTFGALLQTNNQELCYNLLLCLAKFFIHKQKILKSPPVFNAFVHGFRLYLNNNSYEDMYRLFCRLPGTV
uniref:Reverse transcriptase domain-containing protein n=1 Tax=Nothobranchius furzeri TaxID=105023 RepID=A0A8C6M6K1_NOTFU